uniref:Rho GDP dissociation inhibitor (GDI) gamma n=1 Tax=Xiphophorus couchianus TaxID=32473 RepID=A0A3B5MJR0_9TELE
MADKSNLAIEEEDEDRNLNYNPPAQKSLQEIQEMDKDDESLVKYKQTLLGPEAMNPTEPNVRVTRLILLCDDAPEPITMDLTGELSALKETSFTLQEGAKYRLKVYFKVSWILHVCLCMDGKEEVRVLISWRKTSLNNADLIKIFRIFFWSGLWLDHLQLIEWVVYHRACDALFMPGVRFIMPKPNPGQVLLYWGLM